MECLNVFTLFYAASFLIKRVFMKLAMFFTSSARRIFIKLLSVSESSEKLKVRSHYALFLILLFLRLLHTNEFV